MPTRAIFYDTETTGVKAEKDRIIEIAAYDPLNDRSFQTLIHPQMPIPAEATAVHRITDEMVAQAPVFAEAIGAFVDFCQGDTILIAHNNDNFDLHFLRQEFLRSNLTMPSWRFLDSLKWARRYRPDLPRHTLQFLREIYGIPSNTAHRALDDVIVLHKVFQALLDDIPIDTAFSLINRSREISHMPFGKYQGQPLNQLPSTYVRWLMSSGALDKPENEALRQALEKNGLLGGSSVKIA